MLEANGPETENQAIFLFLFYKTGGELTASHLSTAVSFFAFSVFPCIGVSPFLISWSMVGMAGKEEQKGKSSLPTGWSRRFNYTEPITILII